MKTIILVGVIIVILALLFYSLGIFTEQRKRRINKTVLTFLSLGLVFDISATTCMIIGSGNSPFTFHGLIGYTGLIAMTVETVLAFKFYKTHGENKEVSRILHWYSRISYALWLVVFITGSLLLR